MCLQPFTPHSLYSQSDLQVLSWAHWAILTLQSIILEALAYLCFYDIVADNGDMCNHTYRHICRESASWYDAVSLLKTSSYNRKGRSKHSYRLHSSMTKCTLKSLMLPFTLVHRLLGQNWVCRHDLILNWSGNNPLVGVHYPQITCLFRNLKISICLRTVVSDGCISDKHSICSATLK